MHLSLQEIHIEITQKNTLLVVTAQFPEAKIHVVQDPRTRALRS